MYLGSFKMIYMGRSKIKSMKLIYLVKLIYLYIYTIFKSNRFNEHKLVCKS